MCPNVKHDGTPCKNYCIKGGTTCRHHGGTLPRVKAAATFRLARDAAQQEALKRLQADKASKRDTITEMDRLAAEVIAFKDVCRERLDQLLSLDDSIRYEGKTGEQLRAEVALYERSLDRCNTVLATNVKLDIDGKKKQLDKDQAAIVVALVRAILGGLDLTKAQKQLATRVVPEQMRAISNVIQGELVA